MEFPVTQSQAAALLRDKDWVSLVEGEFTEFSTGWLGRALGVKLGIREDSEPISLDWDEDCLLVGAIPDNVRNPVKWVTIRGARAL
jgi:hypothetical protein